MNPPEASGGSKKVPARNCLMQLRKICDHPYLFMNGGWNIDETLIRVSGMTYSGSR